MKEATILAVDLKGFSKKAQSEEAKETSEFLMSFFQTIERCIATRNWRFVKSIGDCVMIAADGITDPALIQSFFDEVSESHPITVTYRDCEFIEQQVETGEYRCLDIIGKDICNLFLRDDKTAKLG